MNRRLERCSKSTVATLLAVACLVAPLPAPAADDEQCAERIRSLRVRGELDRANERLQQCYDRKGATVPLEMERARLLGLRGRYDRALSRTRTLVEDHPEHAGVRLLEIQLLKQSGRTDAALKRVDQFPESLEKPPLLFQLAGTLRVWSEDYTGALEALNTYLERTDGDAQTYYYRGIAHQKIGDGGAAEADYRRACEMAPEKTKACAALHELRRGSGTDLYAAIQPGYSLVAAQLDGWSVDGHAGVDWGRSTLQAGAEWRTRGFGGRRLQDVMVTAQGSTRVGESLHLRSGGAIGIEPDFIPLWNAFGEVGYLFDGGVMPALRFWRVQFPNTGVSVVVPRATVYTDRFRLRGDIYLTIPDADEVSVAGLARASYYYDYPSALSFGLGGGNRSDFIEFRRSDTESHLVALAGISWGLSDRSLLGFDVIHRREQTGPRSYIQTQFLLRYEYRAPIGSGR